MTNKLSILFFFLFFSISYVSVSQENNTLGVNEYFVMHYYTFEGDAGPDKLKDLEQALANLEYVSEAKVKYKSEKSMGQVVLITKEKTITHEGEKSFSPSSIKQIILRIGLSPLDYSVGKYEHK